MQLLKSITTIAVLILLSVITQNVLADQGQKNETEDEGIMTGLVIAYGEILKPPYYITYNLDTVFINGIRVIPGKGDPNRVVPEPPVFKITKLDSMQYELKTSVPKTFYELLKTHGLEEAREELLKKYKNNELLAEFEFRNGDIYIRFKDEKYGEYMTLKTRLPIEESEEEKFRLKTEVSKKVVKNWRELLEMEVTITFGYGFKNGFYHKDKTDKMLELIQEVEESTISKSEAKEEVRKILGPRLADDLWNE
jgi:hypothetical protein